MEKKSPGFFIENTPVAQSVEQSAVNREVEGSSPSRGAISP